MASSVIGAVLMGVGLATAGTAAAATFERLVVFGDSLSDNGNAGRFSNGPVWVEQLAARLAVPLDPARNGGTNFAVGGARLDPRSGPYSLRAQADLFLALAPPRGRPLYVVYGGGNDVLAAVGASGAEDMVDAAAASLGSIVADLVARGARDILVPNLPDIGRTPEIRARGARAAEQGHRLSRRFNAEAERMLAGISSTPGVRLYRLDVWSMAERAWEDPEAFGFMNANTPCGGLDDCEGYVFWDPVHPTTEAHGRLAEAAYRLVTG